MEFLEHLAAPLHVIVGAIVKEQEISVTQLPVGMFWVERAVTFSP